jgi:hypothetical protein
VTAPKAAEVTASKAAKVAAAQAATMPPSKSFYGDEDCSGQRAE